MQPQATRAMTTPRPMPPTKVPVAKPVPGQGSMVVVTTGEGVGVGGVSVLIVDPFVVVALVPLGGVVVALAAAKAKAQLDSAKRMTTLFMLTTMSFSFFVPIWNEVYLFESGESFSLSSASTSRSDPANTCALIQATANSQVLPLKKGIRLSKGTKNAIAGQFRTSNNHKHHIINIVIISIITNHHQSSTIINFITSHSYSRLREIEIHLALGRKGRVARLAKKLL